MWRWLLLLGRKAVTVVGEDGDGGWCWLMWQLFVWLCVSRERRRARGIFTKKTDSGVLAQEDLLVKYTATVDVRMDVPYSICSPVAVCAQDTHPFWRYVNWGKQGFLVV
jgi:hypothetical protein